MNQHPIDRRGFLKASLLGGSALAMPWGVHRSLAAQAESVAAPAAGGLASRVAVAAGEDRADLAFQALKPFARPIAAAIGKKRIILKPNNAVIDGYEGMEGEGPAHGTPVASRVCVASLDWLAADRVALELTGIDYAKMGYLNYCARAGLGQADLAKIEVVGPALKDHIKAYQLAPNIDQQLIWMKPVTNG